MCGIKKQMNCDMLRQYVKNNCGSCNYNWSLHQQFLKDCYNGFYECQDMCASEVFEITRNEWLIFMLILISLFIFVLIIKYFLIWGKK